MTATMTYVGFAITKTGSGFARRLLVEAAWHYLPRPGLGLALAERRAGQPDHVVQIALCARQRLHPPLPAPPRARQAGQRQHDRRRPQTRLLLLGRRRGRLTATTSRLLERARGPHAAGTRE